MTTFRGRLTVALATTTGVFLSIFCLVLYLWCHRAFLHDLEGDLYALQRAEFAANDSLASHLQLGQSSHGESQAFEVFGLITETDGRVIKSTEWGKGFPPQISQQTLKAIEQAGPRFFDLQVNDRAYHVLGSPIKLEGRELIELLGISRAPIEDALHDLRTGLGLSLLLGILLFAAISNLVARYLTQPLEAILGQIDSVTLQANPGFRLTGLYRDEEMASLQNHINAMLERLDRNFQQQRRFVSNASHELRAPLSNLTLAIEVCLRRQREPEDYLEVLHTCHHEARRLSEMTNHLLTLSQTDEGVLNLNRDRRNLVPLVQACLERYRTRAEVRDVRLELSATPTYAWVDEARLAQVLDNVVDNGLRYAPAGSSIELSCAEVAGDAEIRVTDHGPGLTEEQSSQLFERFFRADASRQRGTGGAGLGLAIARGIVEAHGGSIEVQSVPDQSTTFTVRLPLGEST